MRTCGRRAATCAGSDGKAKQLPNVHSSLADQLARARAKRALRNVQSPVGTMAANDCAQGGQIDEPDLTTKKKAPAKTGLLVAREGFEPAAHLAGACRAVSRTGSPLRTKGLKSSHKLETAQTG